MSDIQKRACGRWDKILVKLGVGEGVLDGRHHPCPSCGGTDRFRFDNREGRGTYFCGQCGAGDGFSLVQKIYGLHGFQEAIIKVQECLGDESYADAMKTNKKKANTQNIQEACRRILSLSKAANRNHGYLKKKQIRAYGIGQYKDSLIISVRTKNKLSSLQFIREDGSKVFLKGGMIKGGLHLLKADDNLQERAVITEGYATAASIRCFMDYNVFIAFTANNLIHVARYIREQLPQATIIIAADNDQKTSVNSGFEKAQEAARLIKGKVCLVPGLEGQNIDWNDYHQEYGAAKAKEKFSQLIDLDFGMVDLPQINKGGSSNILQLVQAHQMKPIDWVWEDWLAAGKLHLLSGTAGTGKTTLALEMAAIISKGGVWPDGSRSQKGIAIIWCIEDDLEDSILPRLHAAGADLSNIRVVVNSAEECFDPSTDINQLAMAISENKGVRIVIIDPIVAAITGDDHKNAAVRRSLQPIVDMASNVGAAVLGITHMNKNSKGLDPLDRVTGSLAFGALARVVMATAKPLNTVSNRRLIRVKSNIGPDGDGFEYGLEQCDLEVGIAAQKICWGSPLKGTALELINEVESGRFSKKLHNASAWLKEVVNAEPIPVNEIKRMAIEEGIAWRTLQRAKEELGVDSKKQGFGAHVTWSLPEIKD